MTPSACESAAPPRRDVVNPMQLLSRHSTERSLDMMLSRPLRMLLPILESNLLLSAFAGVCVERSELSRVQKWTERRSFSFMVLTTPGASSTRDTISRRLLAMPTCKQSSRVNLKPVLLCLRQWRRAPRLLLPRISDCQSDIQPQTRRRGRQARHVPVAGSLFHSSAQRNPGRSRWLPT